MVSSLAIALAACDSTGVDGGDDPAVDAFDGIVNSAA